MNTAVGIAACGGLRRTAAAAAATASGVEPVAFGAGDVVSRRRPWHRRPLRRCFAAGIVEEDVDPSPSPRRRRRVALPARFLRAWGPQNYDPHTHQRIDARFDPLTGKPSQPSEESVASPPPRHSDEWTRTQLERWRADPEDFDELWDPAATTDDGAAIAPSSVKRVLWSGWTEEFVRDESASPILFDYERDFAAAEDGGAASEGSDRLLRAMYRYGLALVTNVPFDPAGDSERAVSKLAGAVGYHPLRTLYGTLWSTSSAVPSVSEADGGGGDEERNTSSADSAYGNESLPLHTDMTYSSNPPGVQLFLMVQPANAGGKEAAGQSVYLDGFTAAQQLLRDDPVSFGILAETPRRYRCVDDSLGWNLEAMGPVIRAENVVENHGEFFPEKDWRRRPRKWGPVAEIRHNDLDRLPDLPPHSGGGDNEEFYRQLRHAHDAWDNVLRRDENRLVLRLRPGDCVLVANQRCMHGRYSFDSPRDFPRVVRGCYVEMDELKSKWRRAGYRVV